MNDNDPFLMLERSCDEAVDWVIERVSFAGLSVLVTFDLQVARHTQTACPCPQHGTEHCDCQMVVLLIYRNGQQPLTMIAHGHSGQTWFSVVDTPQQRADHQLEAVIHHLLVSAIPPVMNLVDHASAD